VFSIDGISQHKEHVLRWNRGEGLVSLTKTSGHTLSTSLQHYVNLPFIDEDKKEMKRWVEGRRIYLRIIE